MDFFELVESGHNIFLTGSGGVGKSYNVHELMKRNRDKKLSGHKNIALTATTGIAALNIGGRTIHKFSGLGVYNKKTDIHKIINSDAWIDYKRNINIADIVIIDEISMLRSDSFVLLDIIFREAESTWNLDDGHCRSNLPFGGKQMIFVGDFLQLPPVVLSYENIIGPFAFQTNVWKELKIQTVYLKEVKRQSDVELITALNELRVGKCSAKTLELFQSRITPPHKDVISLTALNKESDVINQKKLEEIEEPLLNFFSLKTWNQEYSNPKLQKSVNYHYYNELKMLHNVSLKKDAKVLVTANGRDESYINGQIGTFKEVGYLLDIGIEKYSCFYHDEYDFGPLIEAKKIIPIGEHGYEYLILDTPNILEDPNSAYKQLELFYEYHRSKALDFSPAFCLMVEVEGKAFVVRDSKEFFHPDQDDDSSTAALTVSQFPIKLGWSISMHKSQGQTLDQVYIDPTSIFDYGQFYVALSRCQSLDGLYLKCFPTRNIKAHPDALAFYKKLDEEILFKENMIKQAQEMRLRLSQIIND